MARTRASRGRGGWVGHGRGRHGRVTAVRSTPVGTCAAVVERGTVLLLIVAWGDVVAILVICRRQEGLLVMMGQAGACAVCEWLVYPLCSLHMGRTPSLGITRQPPRQQTAWAVWQKADEEQVVLG